MAERANERHQAFEADLKTQADAAAQARDESQKLRGRTDETGEDQAVTTTPEPTKSTSRATKTTR